MVRDVSQFACLMNKNSFRIVFNAARRALMVVQETATGMGKAKGTTSAAVGIALALIIGSVPAPAQIVGAYNVPGTLRPTVLAAPNGVALVNIQSPNAQGVSTNIYSHFDVPSSGVVLSNSRTTVRTQLGGYIQGNPWLATGPARIILNEINSGNPTRIRGYIEVGGSKAEVIVANPAGIAVDGGGFINASKATLTTGTPQFNATGALDSYVVRSGTVTIDGAGLDLSQTDHAAILARAVQINGAIHATDLQVVTGANQVSADATQISPTTGTGATPTFALDVAAIGGMFANHIFLVGTEAGLGMRNAGAIQATATGAPSGLMSAGQFVLTTAGLLQNSGIIQASSDASLTASSVTNTGSVVSGASLKVASTSDLSNIGGTLEGERVDLSSTAGNIVNSNGAIRQSSYAALTLAAPSLLNTQGGTIGAEPVPATSGDSGSGSSGSGSSGTAAGGSSGNAGAGNGSGTSSGTSTELSTTSASVPIAPGAISAAGAIQNDGGHIYAAGAISLRTPNVSNVGGTLSVDSMAVSGPVFSNAGGHLNINHAFSANVGSFDNSAGTVHAGSIGVATTGDFNNAAGTLTSDGDANITTGGAANNTQGTISAAGALSANVSGGLTNASGTLLANQAVTIKSQSLDNTLGSIQSASAGTSLAVTRALTNTGNIGAATDLSVQAGSLANVRGASLRAANDTSMAVAGAASNDGSITSGRHTTIAADSLAGAGTLGAGINADGSLGAAGDLSVITTNALLAHGVNLAAGSVALKGASVDLSISKTSASKIVVTATQGSVTTSSATVVTPGTLAITATQAGGTTGHMSGGLVNDQGTIAGNVVTIDTQSSALGNARGTIASKTTLDINSGALINDAGLIQSGAAMTIHTNGQAVSNTNAAGYASAGPANGQGGIASADTLTLDSGAVNNSAGFLGSKNGLLATTGAVSNIDGGMIVGQAGVTINTQEATYNNTGGQTQAVGDLRINAGNVTNSAGLLRANGNTTITASGIVDNSSGLISAGDALVIVDPNAANPTAKTLAITNAAGTLTANKSLKLDAARFSADGTFTSGQDLGIALTQDVANNADIEVSGNLTYITTGNLTNNGKLIAGRTLTAGGSVVENTANAELSGTDTHISATTLNNRGLIDSQGRTRIDAGTVNNIGTGRIYGDAVAIGAGTLNNSAETVSETITGATIAGRSSVDIGAATISNSDDSLIFSAGDMYFGAALDANGYAIGQGSVLNNHSAMIQSLGDMSIAMAAVNNVDTHLTVTQGSTSTTDHYLATTADAKIWSITDTIGNPITGQVWHTNADGTQSLVGVGYGDWHVTTTTTGDIATNQDPAQIVAGGDLAINGHLYNKDSKVIAGGTLTAPGPDNETTQGTAVKTYSGYTWAYDGSGNGAYIPLVKPADPPTTLALGNFVYEGHVNATKGFDAGTAPNAKGSSGGAAGTGAVSGWNGPATVIEVAANVGTLVHASAADGSSGTGAISTVVRTRTPNTALPRASLFSLELDTHSHYLIETDPRFADYRTWLSSNYLLNDLGLDPNNIERRLGDGFYEQQLIDQQVMQLTGYRYVGGYSDDESEYTALMNAGATFAKQYGLTVGVALTAAQMAQLTSDIVWLVSQTVTLPDGTTQQVLVPQVYVRVQPGDIDGSGALLSADKTVINAAPGTGDVTNTGTIAGRTLVSITADNVNNFGGRISGGSVAVTAVNDINDVGGTIDAKNAMTLQAGHDINVHTTTSSTWSGMGAKTVVDRVAGLYVTNPGGTLVASAGNDMNLIAAIVKNESGDSASGLTSITARHDINLDTVQTSERQLTVSSPGNYIGYSNSQEIGSTFSTNGTTVLSANNDINARQASVNSGDGFLSVHANRDINISDGHSSQMTVQGRETSKKNILSSSTTSSTINSSSTTSVGSSFSGGLTALTANNNINIEGSQISGTEGVLVQAGNNLNVWEGRNTTDASISSATSSRTLGLGNALVGLPSAGPSSKSNSSQLEIRTNTAAPSSIQSSQGGVLLQAGGTVFLEGAQVSAAKDISIVGTEVGIKAAVNSTNIEGTSNYSSRGFTGVGQAIDADPSTGFNARKTTETTIDDSSLTRTTLTGANVSITATDTLAMAGTTVNAPGKLSLNADRLVLGTQTTERDTQETSQGRDLVYQKVKDKGQSDQATNYDQFNVGTLAVAANRIDADLGAKDSLAALARQPGMSWVQQLNTDPTLQGKVNWSAVEEAHKNWNSTQQGLTPEGAAIVTLVVAYFTAGAASTAGEAVGGAVGSANTVTLADGALFVGQGLSTSGAIIAGATTAGLSALAGEAAVAMINNQGDIGGALHDLGSSANVKNLVSAVLTGGVLGGLNLDPTGLPTTGTGSQTFMNQLGRNLEAGAAKAVVNTAVNGGRFESNLAESLKTAFLDSAAAQSAFAIGSNIQPGSAANTLAHAIAGCAIGAARPDGSCGAGAIGAAIGELSASLYDPNATNSLSNTVQFASMMSGIAAALSGVDATDINLASQAGANAAANNWLSAKQEAIARAVTTPQQIEQWAATNSNQQEIIQAVSSTKTAVAAAIAEVQADPSNQQAQDRLQTAYAGLNAAVAKASDLSIAFGTAGDLGGVKTAGASLFGSSLLQQQAAYYLGKPQPVANAQQNQAAAAFYNGLAIGLAAVDGSAAVGNLKFPGTTTAAPIEKPVVTATEIPEIINQFTTPFADRGATVSVSDEAALNSLFTVLTNGRSEPVVKGYGKVVTLVDGTTVTLRSSSTSGGATIDINYEASLGSNKIFKIHIGN
jgi:filamentous hemagglutinin